MIPALLGLCATVLAVGLRKLGDFDLPWHLAIGRAFVEGGAARGVDDLSYTFRGTKVPSEYLSEALLWIAYRLGGAPGLQLFGLALIAALAALLVAQMPRDARPLALAATALALVASQPWLLVRPVMFSLVFLVLLLWLLSRRSPLWAIPLVQLAWANAHVLAPLGVAIVWAHAAAGRDRARAIGVAVLATLATLASPFGVRIFTFPLRLGAFGNLIGEWAPFNLAWVLAHDPTILVIFAALLIALVAGRQPDGSRAPAAFDLMLAALAVALAYTRIRMVPVACVLVAPVIVRRIHPLVARARSLPALAAITSLAAAAGTFTAPGARVGWGFDERNLPVAAGEYLAKHVPSGPGFNSLSVGGWLTFRLYPDVRVFIDGRTGWLYPFEFFADYARAEVDPEAFRRLDDRWHFTWAIVHARPLDRFGVPIAQDPTFSLVYQDDTAAVYQRSTERGATSSYRALRHLQDPIDLFAHPPPVDDLAHDAALAAEQAPRAARTQFLAAALAAARQDRARTAAVRAELAATYPDHPGLLVIDAWLAGGLH